MLFSIAGSGVVLLLLLAGLGTFARAEDGGGLTEEPAARLLEVAATRTELVVTVAAERAMHVRLVELRPYQGDMAEAGAAASTAPAATFPLVWTGQVAKTTTVRLPRFADKRDRLYAKFQLTDARGRPLGEPRYVTDLKGVGARDFAFPWPKSRKGITCPVDVDDVIALGTKYVVTNVVLAAALDFGAATPEETWEVDGEAFPINTAYFRGLDAQIKKFTDAGINVTVVLNNPVPKTPDPKNPFLHPATDLAAAPNRLGAFNLTGERGLRAYRAVLEYFADRYSRPDRKYGWITGYIVGNEIQQHWEWYNRGRVDADAFLREYAVALRVTDLAVRKAHSGIRVYVSMDHHWTHPGFKGDPLKEIRGDRVLETLNARTKAGGDFAWNVAFHPYPENLFNPAFWNDRTAVLALDTPRITFKNLEVLPAFLSQKAMRVNGRPRRILLSEQGFHAGDGPEGERLQAAAYAAAYYRVSRMPLVDAFTLHRHVSHRNEGGLRLGLWAWDPESADPSKPGRKFPVYDVYRRADGPDWREAFAFALPVVGITDWSALEPAKRIAPARAASDTKNVAADLIALRGTAKVTNCLDWRQELVAQDGSFLTTLFQHPPKDGAGRATYPLTLPALPPGKRLEFRFATGFTAPTTNGTRFTVRVGDKAVWSETQTGRAFEPRRVDLTAFAGRAVDLTLEVDGLGDIAHDWANWAAPRVLVVP